MQKKFLLPLLALLFMAGGECFASKVIYKAGVSGKTVAFNFPASCVGHQASIWAIGFKRGENITVALTFTNPSGTTLATATSHYNNKYSNSSKTEQAILNFTFPVVAGSYTLALSGKSESENIAQISDTLVVCWGCPGEDVTVIRTEMVTEINDLRGELAGDINTKTATLQGQINTLQTKLNEAILKHNTDQSALLKEIESLKTQISGLETDLRARIASLEQQQSGYLAQLEVLKGVHEKDVAEINQRLAELEAKLNTDIAGLKESVKELTAEVAVLEKEYSSSSVDVRSSIEALEKEQTELRHDFELREQKHQSDIAAIQAQINAKTELIRAEHSADIDRLENSQERLQEKIDMAVADFRQELVTLNNVYKDSVAELKNQIAATESKLASEVSKLSATDKDIYDKISDLREKQADYYARMEVLKVTHDKDKEALEKEMAAIDSKYKTEVEAVNAKIDILNGQISDLQAKHDSDVAVLQREIDSNVSRLDEDIRKIYQELSALKEEQKAYQTEIQKALDEALLRLNELDKSVTERLQNLENRIKYSTYSDEKLESLKKDFEKQIQEKETEIANVDLEIQDLTVKGLDTSAKEEKRSRLLNELLKLRNKLSDIEFAIEIRHNESEFAAHEKEIALLKSELVALRQSHDLEVKQLRDDLIALENKYLQLLDEVKQSAAGENAELKKQLDNLTSKVLAFVDALRSEREAGDTELKALLDAMDVSHKELITKLDSNIADKLDKLKFESDTQFENLRTTINNIAYQQRFNTGSAAQSYTLPSSQVQDVPADSRDLRVSPDASLNSILN